MIKRKNIDNIKRENWLANAAMSAVIVMIFLSLGNASSMLQYAMIASASITGFYFWWGACYIAAKLEKEKSITEYLFDFLGVVIVLALFLIPYSNPNGKLWLLAYAALFCFGVAKNYWLFKKSTESYAKSFSLRKTKIDSLALLLFGLFFMVSLIADIEIYLITAIFFIELLHIIYVDLTKFYEKI